MKAKRYDGQKRQSAAVRSLKIVYRPIEELKPEPSNPLTHSKKQIRRIFNSIATFGLLCPVLVDADGNVIAGHGRLLAGSQLGMTEVPTVAVDHLTPEQI